MTGDEPAGSATRTPIRVLMVLDTFSFGGAENLIVELARYGPRALDVSVASLSPQRPDRDAMAGRLAEVGMRPHYLTVRRLVDVPGFVRLVRALRRAPVDVVHAHLDYSAILVPVAARIAGKPVVATLHVSPQPGLGWAGRLKERLSVRVPARLGRIAFVSQHIHDVYAHRYGPARQTWRVVPNGVDLARYRGRRDQQSQSSPVWAVVAALRPDKNHADLITAWQRVVEAFPDARLLIVGDGPTRPALEQQVLAGGLGDSIEFLGRREDVPQILRSVDGVVSASVDEALPTALIEAGACGLPVVAADAGGTREIVKDRVNGRLVPLRDVDALAEALVSTIGDAEFARDCGARARAMAEESYSLPAWVARLGGLYREVIDESR